MVAVAASIDPVKYLQSLIVFSAAACGATFFVPAWMLAYWPRATAAGTGAAMLAGAGTILGLFITGLVLAAPGLAATDRSRSRLCVVLSARLSSDRLRLGGVAGRRRAGQPGHQTSAARRRGQTVSAAAGRRRIASARSPA